MSDIRKLVKDIDRGKNLKNNLPVYGKILADTYLNYAAIELVFSAYILAESMADATAGAGEISGAEKEIYDKVMELLHQAVCTEPGEMAGLAGCAEELRDRVTKVMDVYTSYTDRLLCYDYVLSRMKMRYKPEKEVLAEMAGVNEDEFVQRLMLFVTGDGDKSVMKERLQILMGMIPVRMTKSKFLEKLTRTVTLYKDGDKASLENFVYMVRSAAMLHRPDESAVSDGQCQEMLDKLGKTDFLTLDEKTYTGLTSEMEKISEKILLVTDFYYSLQKVINGIYALCLASAHSVEKTGVYADCIGILKDVTEGRYEEESLVPLEGKIEGYVDKSSYLEAVLYEVKSACGDTLSELGLLEDFEDYAMIANLLSDSLFIDLKLVRDDEVVDGEALKNISGELSEELSELLGGLTKPVRRAVMASVLEKLPVDFTNVNEVELYIRTNLFGCQDLSEKSVVLSELNQWMEEANR